MRTISSLRVTDEIIDVEFEVLHTSDSSQMNNENPYINEIESRIISNDNDLAALDKKIAKLTNQSDGTDYLIAVVSGIITGLIDVFFVGELSLEKSSEWGKEKVDKLVNKVASKSGFKGNSIEDAIRFLEKKFPIAADKVTDDFGGGLFHHLRDFSHHASILGLVFSLLTQFTGKVFGTNNLGAFKVVDVPDRELIGKDFHTKIVLGVVQWLLHLISDMAGCSGSYANGKYGTGIPGPLVSLLKVISSLPFFNHKENQDGLVKFVSKLFNGTLLMERDENGKIIKDSVIKFDLRTEIGAAAKQSIPVVINECIVRGAYFIRRLSNEIRTKKIANLKDFIKEAQWSNFMPFRNRTIIRMLTISCSTFTVIDMAGAAIKSAMKSGGEPAAFATTFFLNVNFAGIGRLAIAITSEVKMGIKRNSVRNQRIKIYNEQLMLYNAKLFYRQADMWKAAEESEAAIEDLYRMAEQYAKLTYLLIADSRESMGKISKHLLTADKNNPGLLDSFDNILKN